MVTERVTASTEKTRRKWIEAIQDAINTGVPKYLRNRLETVVAEIEKSIAYGGTTRLRERLAELEASQTRWIEYDGANLPEPYVDVFVRRRDGTYCVARVNHKGIWERAAYQKNHYQYTVSPDEIEAWMAPDLKAACLTYKMLDFKGEFIRGDK